MGLGILFVGYFLIMNFAYSYFTDAIAAAVMLYALYKLAYLNSGFKRAMSVCVGFLIFGIFEFVLSVVSSLMPTFDLHFAIMLKAILRHLIIFALTFFVLDGIKKLAEEVELPYLAKRCLRNTYLGFFVYALNIILEAASLSTLINSKFLAMLYVLSVFLTTAYICMNLVQIYSAHMHIYLPQEEKKKDKTSRFGFINDFQKHEEERSKEYAEYKLSKMKAKKDKKRKK